jgi:hypothetical protein
MFRNKGLLLIALSLVVTMAAAWTVSRWTPAHSAAAVQSTTVKTSVVRTARLTGPEPETAQTTIVVRAKRVLHLQ